MSGRIDEAQDFLRELWGDVLPLSTWLLVWSLADRRSHWRQSIAEAATVAAGLDGDVYHGVALHSIDHGPTKRGPADAVAFLPGFWLDVDWHDPVAHKAADLPPDSTAATKLLEESPLRPSLVVESGYGLQAYWLFPKPWDVRTCRREAAALSVAWQTFLIEKAKRDHGWKVDATHDLARVLRLPGTLNRKGGEPRPVTVLRNSIERYDPDEFRGVLALNDLDENGGLVVAAPKAKARGREHFERIATEGVKEGDRNASLASWIGKLIAGRTDLDEADSVRMLLDSARLLNETRFKPPLPDEEVRRTFRSILTREKQRRDGDELAAFLAPTTEQQTQEAKPDAGEWRLEILYSDPKEFRLYHPSFERSEHGYVSLTSGEMTNGHAVRTRILEQASVPLPRGFAKFWDSRPDPETLSLYERLAANASHVTVDAEARRRWQVAARLLDELARARPYDETARKPDRQQPATIEDGSIVFSSNTVFEALQRSADKIERAEFNRLLALLNATSYRSPADKNTRFRRIDRQGIEGLRAIVLGTDDGGADDEKGGAVALNTQHKAPLSQDAHQS